MTAEKSPEIALSIQTGSFKTNYHDWGKGSPVLLIHGSGPGVSAWANWGRVLPKLALNRRVIAPDMVGFGFTDRPQGITYSMEGWLQQAVDFLDALGLQQVDVVGNSFGGALALWLVVRHPERVRRLVLMGAVGVRFDVMRGLDAVWGYTPSIENMRAMLDTFAYSRVLVNEELAQMRYQASIRPGFQESFSAMFPAPRQRWVDEMARYEDQLPNIQQPTLIIHGREDRIIPVENSLTFFNGIPNAQLHIFGKCGHWTQIEHTDRFVRLVDHFLAE